jgi:hypothetical protein
MSDFAKLGILRDSRIDRARVLLTRLYGGRRIDALDMLFLPAQPAPSATPQDVVVANTPLPWLEHKDLGVAHDPRSLWRGVTDSMRADVRKIESGGAPPAGSENLLPLYARARLDMGRVYWRRVDFVEAAHAAKPSSKPEDRLVLAVSLALAQGPNGAAEMMRAATPATLDLKHTEALDALVTEGGPLAGMAAFDAAHLRALSPPDGDDATPYLRDVSARFRKSESLLTDPAQKKAAAQRAGEVDAIVAAGATKTKP